MPSRRKHIRRKSLRRTKSRRGGAKPGTRLYFKKSFEERNRDYWKARQNLTEQRNHQLDLHTALVKQILESGSGDAFHDGNLSNTIYSEQADALNEQITNLHLNGGYFTEQEIAAAQRKADQNAAEIARKREEVRDLDRYALGY